MENCKYYRMGHPTETVLYLWQNLKGMQKDQLIQGSMQVNVETAARAETTKDRQVDP